MNKYRLVNNSHYSEYFEKDEIVTIETFRSLNVDGDPMENFIEKDGAIYERYFDCNEIPLPEEIIAVEIK